MAAKASRGKALLFINLGHQQDCVSLTSVAFAAVCLSMYCDAVVALLKQLKHCHRVVIVSSATFVPLTVTNTE